MIKFEFELTEQEFNNLKSLFRANRRHLADRIGGCGVDTDLRQTLNTIVQLDNELEQKIVGGAINPPSEDPKIIKLTDGCRVKLSDGSEVVMRLYRNPRDFIWCFKMDDEFILHDYSHQYFTESGSGYHNLNVVSVL